MLKFLLARAQKKMRNRLLETGEKVVFVMWQKISWVVSCSYVESKIYQWWTWMRRFLSGAKDAASPNTHISTSIYVDTYIVTYVYVYAVCWYYYCLYILAIQIPYFNPLILKNANAKSQKAWCTFVVSS